MPQDYADFQPETLVAMENTTTRSFSLDATNKIMWFGGLNGTVHKVVINDADFPASVFTSYQLPTNQTIIGVQADPVRGYLYAATVGDVNNPIVLFFINVAAGNFTVDSNVTCDPTDYNAIAITFDPLGLLYISADQSPPSIIQIDIANRNYENTVRLGPESGAQASMMFDAINNKVFTGSFDISKRLSILRYDAAFACESGCYGHGNCSNRHCSCINGTSDLGRPFQWQQPWCQSRPCDIDSSNGLICGGPDRAVGCNNGTCLCSANYTGVLCETRQCSRNCSGAGTCGGASSGYICSCNEGRGGDDCSLITKLPCIRYTTCSGCMENPSCGWCEAGPVRSPNGTNNGTAYQCVEGSALGPYNGYLGCRSWHFRECPSIAITVGSAIIFALVAILFLINAVSFIWEDAGERPSKRLQWYRFQRSSKAYAALWQLQYFAVVTILAAITLAYPSPTAFISYTRVWLPIVGVHGYGIVGPRDLYVNLVSNDTSGISTSNVVEATGVTQMLVWADLMESSFMRSVMATWAVLLGIMLVVYLIGLVICSFIRGSERLGEVIVRRPLYILLRAIEIGYYPMVVFGAAQLSYRFREPAWAALGGVFYVVIGIVYPAGMTILVSLSDKNTLFKEDFIAMFYPFYGTVDHKKAVFAVLPWLKKFIIGSAFGFGIFSLLGQVITTLITCIVYAVGILLVSPYVDYLQQYLDIVTTVLTALSTLPLFAFTVLNLSPGGILGATLVFVILNVLSVASCIGFYIYSWCQMKGIFALSQCARCLSCSDE